MGKAKKLGSGWYGQRLRHSRARKFGKADIKAPLYTKSTKLPIQFSLIIPSTKEKKQILNPEEFQERIDKTTKYFTKKYGGDTKIRAQGDYISKEGEFIPEDNVILEVSMKKSDYDKDKKALASYIKRKKNEWGQESLLFSVEDDTYIYPAFD